MEWERVFGDNEARAILPRHWTLMGAYYRAYRINQFGIKSVHARVHRLGWFDFRAIPYVCRADVHGDFDLIS